MKTKDMPKIDQPVSFQLPKPWLGQEFSHQAIGDVCFLVGPNGSGKSRFAEGLKRALPNARLLGTDRLEGMGINPLKALIDDQLANGLAKNQFQHFRSAGT